MSLGVALTDNVGLIIRVTSLLSPRSLDGVCIRLIEAKKNTL